MVAISFKGTSNDVTAVTSKRERKEELGFTGGKNESK